MDFDGFLKKVKDSGWEFYGIEVFLDGKVIHSYEKIPGKRYPIYSATKTITATAAGIAAAEGKFDIHATVYDCFRKELSSGISPEQIENLKKITIKRLLTMSVEGYPFRPQGEDWIADSLRYPLKDVEQKKFCYSNIPACLVGAAVEIAVGEPLMEYLKPRLWDPLEIRNPVWKNCPSGHFYGASGMEMTVNELSRIGQLYLQNGVYGEQQLLDPAWVREATSVQQRNREGGYGYFIWKYKEGYRISGKWGQRCFVFPDRGLMVTFLANVQEDSEKQKLIQAMEQYLTEC